MSYSQFHSDEFRRPRDVLVAAKSRQRRAKAVWALFCSILVFVPFAGVIGTWLGFKARRANQSLATMAMLLGLLCTAAQGFVAWRGFEHYQHLTQRPSQALTSGMTGDLASFRQAFGEDLELSDIQARSFLEELSDRYGVLIGVDQAESGDPLDLVRPTASRSFVLRFERATIVADASVALEQNPGADWLSSNIASLTVRDPDRGDLTYPGPAMRIVSQPTD